MTEQPYQQPFPSPNPYPQSSLLPPLPPGPPQKKRKHTTLFIVVAMVSLLVGLGAVGALAGGLSSSPQSSNTTPDTQATTLATELGTPTQDESNPTPTDTVATAPVLSEQDYKALTASTTVATLDKDGNVDQGKDVHFTAEILDFVKDSNGNTAGANVDDPNISGVIQVIFPASTDLSQLNTSDTLEVWGTDDGTSSGTNAYGATIQEVGVSAVYITDHTTRYSTS